MAANAEQEDAQEEIEVTIAVTRWTSVSMFRICSLTF